jgi:hypothetical protein
MTKMNKWRKICVKHTLKHCICEEHTPFFKFVLGTLLACFFCPQHTSHSQRTVLPSALSRPFQSPSFVLSCPLPPPSHGDAPRSLPPAPLGELSSRWEQTPSSPSGEQRIRFRQWRRPQACARGAPVNAAPKLPPRVMPWSLPLVRAPSPRDLVSTTPNLYQGERRPLFERRRTNQEWEQAGAARERCRPIH